MVLLCDGGLAINMLSSIVMNGVCCLHNLSAEEERNRQQQEELRRTINVEYERQRLFDKECRDRMRREEQLLVEKQRLVAEQLHQRQQRGGGDVMLLCDGEHNSDVDIAASRRIIDNNAHLDTRSVQTIGMSNQHVHCPRRALMAKKLQLSSPISPAAMSSPATSFSPCETSVNRAVDGSMSLIQDDQRLNRVHSNNADGIGRRRRYAYGISWNDTTHARARRGAPQQRDDMSSSCASSTVSLFDDSSSSDEEAE